MAVNYDAAPILKVEGLKQYFKVSKNPVLVSQRLDEVLFVCMIRLPVRLLLTELISAAD